MIGQLVDVSCLILLNQPPANQAIPKDWFMTLETSALVGSDSFKERFTFLKTCSEQNLCGETLLPLPDHDLQGRSVCSYVTMLADQGALPEVLLKDIHHEVNIFPPVVLGLGHAKLRHKLAALIHQFRLELGNDVALLKRYCASIVSVCSDQGTESGIFSVPAIDLAVHLRNEAAALSKDCGEAAPVLYALQMPHAITLQPSNEIHHESKEAGAVEQGANRASNSGAGDQEGARGLRLQLHAAASLINRLFPNCIFIPGIKHSMDNCLQDTWGAMRAKEQFLKQLGAIEYLMKQPAMRAKLAYVFFDDKTPFDKSYSHLLKHWGPTLQSLRWHAVIDFLRSLLKLEDGLRKKWDLACWLKAVPLDRKEEAGEGRVKPSVTYKMFDQAIHSAYFWTYARMLLHLSDASETLSHWAEGCWYHGDACSQKDCAFKGARAPELASGAHKFLLNRFQSSADVYLSTMSAALSHSEAQSLATDHHTASARLALEWEYRLHFWDLLPWKLCGLAVSNIDIVRVNAGQVLDMWSRMSQQQQRLSHPMTRRFLDAAWRGWLSKRFVCDFQTRLAH